MILNEKRYPAIHAVCDMYDVCVQQSIVEPTEHSNSCASRDNSPDHDIFFECTCKPVPAYFLGQPEDLDAGLYAYDLTTWFRTLDELEEFCYRNMDEFLRCMDRMEELNLSEMK